MGPHNRGFSFGSFVIAPILCLLGTMMINTSTFVITGYGESEEVFDYGDGLLGPSNWGNIREEWRDCGEGKGQSPVGILKKDLVHINQSHNLQFLYQDGAANLSIREHDVAVDWVQDGGAAFWDGQEYKLISLHFHTPSEHTVNGVKYAMELHMLHEGPKKEILVVAILYKDGKEDGFLKRIMDEFPYLHGTGNTEVHIGNVSMSSIKIGTQYYHYMGSLTTPPCTEGVTWIVMKKKRSVSRKQVDEITIAELGENARPTQPLNGRIIYKYK